MDVGGVDYVDTYVKFSLEYGIPCVILVDNDYKGGNTASEDFVILPSKLEGELVSIGLNVVDHVCPNDAYELVFDAMQNQKVRDKIHFSNIGRVFDRALKIAGVADPQKEIWRPC